MTRSRILLIAVIGALMAGGAAYLSLRQPARQTPPADPVLRGGRIVALGDRTPEAQALAARDGWIVAVGSISERDLAAAPVVPYGRLFSTRSENWRYVR